jgi:hypothetical protein
VLCAMSGMVSSAAAQQSAAPLQSADAGSVPSQPPPLPLAQLPDSPGATLAKLHAPALQLRATLQAPESPAANEVQASGAIANGSATNNQDQQIQPQQPPAIPQKPVGTAAAEPTHAGGIAASQPAGVAIAPAKQRRVRTIVIRVGAILGAGVAVGSVVALTEATSSKPPGAH